MVSNDQSEDAHAANGMIMNNNVAYRAKQAGGTVKDLMKLGTDDILRLSQLRYQKDDADSIASSTEENLMIQFGWGQKVGDGTASIEDTVTFPTAFGTPLFVTASSIGAKVGGAAADITALNTLHVPVAAVETEDLTTTGFGVGLSLGTGSFGVSDYHGYSWIAIGTKS